MRTFVAVVLTVLALAAVAFAQNVTTVNQGKPGTQGPWPVTLGGSVNIVFDGGLTFTGGSIIATGPDGGAVLVNITQSIPIQVFMDGGQRIIVDQGTSPWVVSGNVTTSTDGGFLGYVLLLADGGLQNVNVQQWGGANTSLGQKTSASSVPVVLPSDQTLSVIVILDGGSTSTFPIQCRSTALDGGAVEQNTTVGTSATQVPASPSVGRVYVNICNSAQNASTAVVKCRQDGQGPVFAAGNPGQVLLFGDCMLATAPTSANTIQCIADAAGRNVTTYECVPL